VPTTLTLMNIPDELYERLKASSRMHRRSMRSEAIACLAAALLPAKATASERLSRARALRAMLSSSKFSARDIDALKKAGRPRQAEIGAEIPRIATSQARGR